MSLVTTATPLGRAGPTGRRRGSAGPPAQGAVLAGLGRSEPRVPAAADHATKLDPEGRPRARATTGGVVKGTTPASRRARWSARSAGRDDPQRRTDPRDERIPGTNGAVLRTTSCPTGRDLG